MKHGRYSGRKLTGQSCVWDKIQDLGLSIPRRAGATGKGKQLKGQTSSWCTKGRHGKCTSLTCGCKCHVAEAI